MYLDRVRKLFENVDWAPLEAEVNTLYNMEGRGITLRALGRHAEALESYNKALELNPDDDETLNNRGGTLRALERFDEARARAISMVINR